MAKIRHVVGREGQSLQWCYSLECGLQAEQP